MNSLPRDITMRFFIFSSVLLFGLLLLREPCEALPAGQEADIPPRGWNSYGSYSWTISEQEFLANALVMKQRLLPHGYKYVVLDYLWYRKNVDGSTDQSPGYDVIDEWGRPIPDPDRWPSSKGGKGLSEVAKKVHDMGLKFGIHVMRGISRQALNANTRILDITKGGPYEDHGQQFRAQDIAREDRPCSWMKQCFMLVDTNSGAGKAFLRSLYHQYAEWGVDFVKHDCIFGYDLDAEEIRTVSEILRELDRPIVYSISPGTNASPVVARKLRSYVNMYRITGNDWDKWEDVAAHFDVARDFSNNAMIGVGGLQGKSWPDLDMLPFGMLTDPGSKEGPHRASNLTPDEERTQFTLWSMAKSPLMYGGDPKMIGPSTFELITNPVLLEINSYSTNNVEFPYISGTNARSWIAVGRKGEVYLAFFNLGPDRTEISMSIADFNSSLPGRDWSKAACRHKELFSGKDNGIVNKRISAVVETHSCVLFILNCN